MDDNKKNKPENDKEVGQQEGTFARDSKERKQDFSNEQDPHKVDGSTADENIDNSSGNLSDQYHSATVSGENQNKKNLENTKAAHDGDEYYDRGAHQPDATDIKKVDEDKAVDKYKDE